MVIEIAKEFSRTPGGRLISDGPFSGELFRDRYLAPRLLDAQKRDGKLVVVLDGVRGYLSSFLEEAFGGLVRSGFRKRDIDKYLEVRAKDRFYEPYKVLALRYIDEADEKAGAA